MGILWLLALALPASSRAASLDLPPLDKLFDGAPLRRQADDKNFVHELDVRNGELRRFSVTYVPWGLEIQGGYLGLSTSRSSLVSLSPYVNVIKRVDSKPNSILDYRVQAQLGLVDLTASYFDKQPDSQSDAFLRNFSGLAGRLGLNDKDTQKVMSYASYQDSPQTTRIVLGSVLAEVGRAYSIYGPLDMAWAAGGLVKFSYLFPNANFDLSAGPRYDLGHGRSISVYGGLTENPTFFGTHVVPLIFSGNPSVGLQWQPAPHAAVSFVGPMPGKEDLQLQLAAERQWNMETKADQYRAGFETTIAGKPVDVYGVWRHEYGPAIEYDRLQELIGLTVHLSKELSASAGYQNEKIEFGDAHVKNESVTAGLSWKWGSGGNKTVTVEEQAGGRDRLTTEPGSADWSAAAAKLNAAVGQALTASESADALLSLLNTSWTQNQPQIVAGIQDLSNALRRLPPDTRQTLLSTIVSYGRLNPPQTKFLQDLLGGVDPQTLAQELGQVQVPQNLPPIQLPIDLSPIRQNLQDVQSLLALFSDQSVLEAVAVRFGRAQAIQALESIHEPIGRTGMTLSLTPAVLLAGVQIIQNRPSTLAPVTKADMTQTLEPWIWKSAAQAMGMNDQASPDQISAELLSRLSASAKAALTSQIDRNFYERLGSMTGPQAANRLLGYLPPSLQDSLRAKYGGDLSRLISAGLSNQQAVDKIIGAAVDQAVASYLGPNFRQAADAAASWMAGLLRKELNESLLQMILAAEQLDSLNVDQGERLSTLQNRFLDRTYDQLAKRRQRVKAVLHGASAQFEIPR